MAGKLQKIAENPGNFIHTQTVILLFCSDLHFRIVAEKSMKKPLFRLIKTISTWTWYGDGIGMV